MLSVFNQEYPAPTASRRSIFISLCFGAFISLFLILFEPFDINKSVYDNKFLVLSFYGLISTSVLIVFLFLLPFLIPSLFSDKHWKVKHQILFYFIILFIIATLNGFYINYIDSLNFRWSNYWWIINRTFLLGGIPISFLTLLDYSRKQNFYSKEARQITNKRKDNLDQSESIIKELHTELKSEMIYFDESKFLYAEAVGNYIDVFSANGEEVDKATYRTTLSSFENQLKSPHLVRCHRSYLANLSKVIDASGNAQGLKLKFPNHKDFVPVSRQYVPLVRSVI